MLRVKRLGVESDVLTDGVCCFDGTLCVFAFAPTRSLKNICRWEFSHVEFCSGGTKG